MLCPNYVGCQMAGFFFAVLLGRDNSSYYLKGKVPGNIDDPQGHSQKLLSRLPTYL